MESAMHVARRLLRFGLPLLSLALVAVSARAEDSTSVASRRIRIHWHGQPDTARVLEASPEDVLQIVATISGADSLRGFEIHLRAVAAGESRAWTFTRSAEDCPPPVLEVTGEGSRAAPAPWRGKLVLSDARPKDDGSTGIVAMSAFHLEPLNPDSTYTLCRLRLVPPAGDAGTPACGGWDAGARLELAQAGVLLTGNREIWVTDLGPPLTVVLRAGAGAAPSGGPKTSSK